MFDRQVALAGRSRRSFSDGLLVALALVSLSACGGTGGGIGVSISRFALDSSVNAIDVDIHNGNRTCDVIHDRHHDLFPSYRFSFGTSILSAGSGDLEAIRPGNYTVAVWGLSGGTVVQWFCEQNVFIADGKRQTIDATLQAF
jgi:hypothetical protein